MKSKVLFSANKTVYMFLSYFLEIYLRGILKIFKKKFACYILPNIENSNV